jgi:hypothetical protein
VASPVDQAQTFEVYVHGRVKERTGGCLPSLPPCNLRIKHAEGLSKCSWEVLTVNFAEGTVTTERCVALTGELPSGLVVRRPGFLINRFNLSTSKGRRFPRRLNATVPSPDSYGSLGTSHLLADQDMSHEALGLPSFLRDPDDGIRGTGRGARGCPE